MIVNKVDVTLVERNKMHGHFGDNAAVSQQLKDVLRAEPGYDKSNCQVREAMDQICSKLSRWVANPVPAAYDNFLDIAGYATLALDSLNAQEEEGE